MKNGPGVIWIKIAVVYFVIGVAWGIYMGASGDHSLFAVHAHINLLGWVSLALIGLIYRQFPELANTTLAKIQFWLHNLGLPFLMIVLTGLLRGNAALEPVVGIASAVVGLAVVLFAVNVFRNMASTTA
jgi:hypothetical protein